MSNLLSAGAARPDSLAQLSRETLIRAPSYGESFLRAQPFRHVLMDSFFEEAFAERLLGDFPPFDPALAKNEIYGGVWGKAANPRIRAIGPVYRELYELIESRAFLDWIGEITGISGLVFDPPMYGGGTHENLDGQDLDPHVDFNYDEAQQLHRRLNLIVYLNQGWKPSSCTLTRGNRRKTAANRIARSLTARFCLRPMNIPGTGFPGLSCRLPNATGRANRYRFTCTRANGPRKRSLLCTEPSMCSAHCRIG